jgi:hypothetical protein
MRNSLKFYVRRRVAHRALLILSQIVPSKLLSACLQRLIEHIRATMAHLKLWTDRIYTVKHERRVQFSISNDLEMC